MQDDIRETAEFQVVEAFHAAQFAPGTAHVHAAEDCVPTSDGAQPTSIAPPGFYPSLASISISSSRRRGATRTGSALTFDAVMSWSLMAGLLVHRRRLALDERRSRFHDTVMYRGRSGT